MNKMAFPLVSLQYNYLEIKVTMRPIKEIFQIRNVLDQPNNFPVIQPNFNDPYNQFYRFLQPPPDISLNSNSYVDKRTLWDADIHLLSTYCFLSKDETKLFASKEQRYLIKEVREKNFYDIAGTQRVNMESLGMIANWTWYFQRDDAYMRNEWSNYTNWSYDHIPYDVSLANIGGTQVWNPPGAVCPSTDIGPGLNPNGTATNLYVSGQYKAANNKDILMNMGILMDGKYRENTMKADVYHYVDKYTRTSGNGCEGQYFYNFGLKTNPYDFQPSGAMNMSRFKSIELEFTTFPPVLDPSAAFYTICDTDGTLVGVNKTDWRIYLYNYNLKVFEERYNMITFVAGNAGLMYAK
jgi:hypothetical protein